MKDTLRKLVAKISRGQKGFTLIEMIVVVGIIAVLAAVIVPNMGNFIGQGKEGAKSAEEESVQTALNAMMADKGVDTVTAVEGTATAIQDWTSYPAGGSDVVVLYGDAAQDEPQYLQDGTTTYFYCYDAQGKVLAQFETAANCDGS